MNELASEQRLRLFVALPVPEAVKTEIERAQIEFKNALPEHGVRWTKPEQFHVTLKFLGDVEASRVSALVESVRAYCRQLTKLELCAKRIGFFPSERKPRAIWAGTSDPAGLLPKLYETVHVATCEFATERKEEKFTGHITLARVRNLNKADGRRLQELAAQMKERRFGKWTGDHIEIVQSQLSSAGAHYIVLAKIELGDELAAI